MQHPELLFFFFAIALIYASVGFGGGSSYLALLALYALPFKEIRFIALVCNIIVVSSGTFIFFKNKQLDWKKILPLVALSIPLSFLGAWLRLSETIFFILLGCTLVIASIFLWVNTRHQLSTTIENDNKNSVFKNSVIGGVIGFVSGLVGIGGGIFLSPVLNLMHWDTAKKIAAAASVFILVNSLAGLAGQWSHLPATIDFYRIIFLGGAVFLGGQIGSRIGVAFLPQQAVRRVTAILVFCAGLEVLLKHLSFK